jgi:hypothetical protein
MHTKIENFLDQKLTGRLLPIDEGGSMFVYRTDDRFGVLVRYDNADAVKLRFSSAGLCDMDILGECQGRYLFFYCTEDRLLHQFSLLCSNFVEPTNQARLRANPREFWESWKELLGNTISNKASYPMLGELVLYMILLGHSSAEVVWGGPDGALHDIETSAASYEVKSTIVRTESSVTISNEYQLESTSAKPLYLSFMRFEERLGGEYSLRKCVEGITDAKIKSDVAVKLKKHGYEPGVPAYAEEYSLLESRIYLVDDKFPKITVNDLERLGLREAVLKVSYEVKLDGLAFQRLVDHSDPR